MQPLMASARLWRPAKPLGARWVCRRCQSSSAAAGKKAAGHWASEARRREFFDSQATARSITDPKGWASVRVKDIIAAGGAGALAHHSGSLRQALADLYPDSDFSHMASSVTKYPYGHWKKQSNRRAFLEALAVRFGFRCDQQDGWKHVTSRQVAQEGGSGLLRMHGDSVYAALVDAFPEVDWDERQCRPRVGRAYWSDLTNQRRCLDDIGALFHVIEPKDWRNVTTTAVQEAGGASLLQVYGGSMAAMLEGVYGKEWAAAETRRQMPNAYWQEESHVRRFMDEVKERYAVEEKEQWYSVSQRQLAAVGGAAAKTLRLVELLRLAYPTETWDEKRCGLSSKKSQQRMVGVTLRQLLGERQVLENHYLPALQGSRTLELDFFVPSLDLAVEYQGEHHYEEVPAFGTLEAIQRRDERKREKCAEAGIRLVEVPYWWDETKESLAATIHVAHPSLLSTAL